MTSVFHIGFPKSGSTFLQRQVFPKLDDYKYMGLNSIETHTRTYNLVNKFHINLFKTDGLNFDIDECIEDRDCIEALSDGKPQIYSYEYAIGVLFGYPDAVTKAERLAKVFGKNIKIVMIVREQIGILSSQYRDHPFEPHDIHRGKPISFDKWYDKTNKLRFFRFTDLIHYDCLIKVYDDLFGRDNVLVLPMELMSGDSALYAKKMGKFLNIDPNLILENLNKPPMNVGNSSRRNKIRRLRRIMPIPIEFSKILPTPLYGLICRIIAGGKQEKVVVSEAVKKEIKQRYSKSNKELEKRMGVPLEPLGYSVDNTDDESELITITSPYGIYTGYKSDRAISQTQKFGAHTRPELSMVLSFVKENDNVLDIGAHIGTFAIPLKNKIGSNGSLFAFEANPQTVKLLKKNLKDNNLDGTVFNNGVSVNSGSLFIQERINKYKSSGSDYLVDKPTDSNAELTEVELIKVDDALPENVNIDFIKIDVEGMEIDVLKSAIKVIDQSRPVIYSEYVEGYLKRAGAKPKEFEEFFKERNYHFFMNVGARNASNDDFKLVRIPGPKYIRGQVDFLLFPKESKRYPVEFSNWYNHSLVRFLWNRFRNLLKDTNAKLNLKK